jgi:hypothetical protein
MLNMDLQDLPPVKDRIPGTSYIYNGEYVIWHKGRLKCQHLRSQYQCRDCGGNGICYHNRRRWLCKPCNGIPIPKKNKKNKKYRSKIGFLLCQHRIFKYKCRECKNDF